MTINDIIKIPIEFNPEYHDCDDWWQFADREDHADWAILGILKLFLFKLTFYSDND